MTPPPKERLRALTDEEEATLTRLSKAGSARADQVRRATALLAVREGRPSRRRRAARGSAAARRSRISWGASTAGGWRR